MTTMYEFRSVQAAREVEKFLAMQQISYRTRIVKTKKRGLRYEITIMVP